MENAHIFITRDGSYRLYVDGQFVFELDENQVKSDSFESLSIIEEDYS